MTSLLGKQGHKIIITEDILKSVARNKYQGDRLISLLLEKKGDQITITGDVLEVVAENKFTGRRKQGDKLPITEEFSKQSPAIRTTDSS